MSSIIIKYEELSINAFPALLTEIYDGWILRYANGYTYRANSVNPIYTSSESLDRKVNICEEKYFQKGLPCVFKMTDNLDSILDGMLEKRGYDIQKSADIMERKLAEESFMDQQVDIEYVISDEWFEAYVKMNEMKQESIQGAARGCLDRIGNPVICASIKQEGMVVAIGLGVYENGYVGLFDILVHEDYRRRGLGMRVVNAILQEGQRMGTHTAYLQVVATNSIAVNMYERLGFEKVYTYWYRVKQVTDRLNIND
ncbi:MAG TPA: GNAT family N-acetyltransferase [Lachnospiraceae bacterium]|nr:GNAT family N-acetyltransferase [Lachnospiraceae bacterium]